jgi:hypothetical protein
MRQASWSPIHDSRACPQTRVFGAHGGIVQSGEIGGQLDAVGVLQENVLVYADWRARLKPRACRPAASASPASTRNGPDSLIRMNASKTPVLFRP